MEGKVGADLIAIVEISTEIKSILGRISQAEENFRF
jgi:hypothetical protein